MSGLGATDGSESGRSRTPDARSGLRDTAGSVDVDGDARNDQDGVPGSFTIYPIEPGPTARRLIDAVHEVTNRLDLLLAQTRDRGAGVFDGPTHIDSSSVEGTAAGTAAIPEDTVGATPDGAADSSAAPSDHPTGCLNAEQAAEYLGGAPISAATVKNLARRKQIGHIKVGRTTVFPITALDAYIAAHTVEPVENPWGLTDAALRTVRNGRVKRA